MHTHAVGEKGRHRRKLAHALRALLSHKIYVGSVLRWAILSLVGSCVLVDLDKNPDIVTYEVPPPLIGLPDKSKYRMQIFRVNSCKGMVVSNFGMKVNDINFDTVNPGPLKLTGATDQRLKECWGTGQEAREIS